MVSLGCEKASAWSVSFLPICRFLKGIPGNAGVIRLQDERGFFGNYCGHHARGEEKHLALLDRQAPNDLPVADLMVGLQCGGSDAFSGITCNPAVGYAADLLVRAGATVMFSEITEVRDAVHLLTPRAAI